MPCGSVVFWPMICSTCCGVIASKHSSDAYCATSVSQSSIWSRNSLTRAASDCSMMLASVAVFGLMTVERAASCRPETISQSLRMGEVSKTDGSIDNCCACWKAEFSGAPPVSTTTYSPISGCTFLTMDFSGTSAETMKCGRMLRRTSANLSRVSLCSFCSRSTRSTSDCATNSPSTAWNGSRK